MACSLDDHNSIGQGAEHTGSWGGGGGGVCVCPCFHPPSPDIKANSDSGGLRHPRLLSTQETKHRAAGLHRIKQSLNASSCYTLPNETFMKGPLMRFQKHLVISPLGSRKQKCGYMNEWALLKNHSIYEWRCLWFYCPTCTSHGYCLVSFT